VASNEESNFRLIAEYSAEVICRCGTDNRFTYVSPSCVRVLGWSQEEMLRMEPLGLVLAGDRPALVELIQHNLTTGAEPKRGTFRARRKDGSIIWVEANPGMVRDPETQETQEAVLVMRDITDRVNMEEKLTAFALTDSLTGLANRRAFDEALKREWNRTERDESRLTILILDIDHFKEFNDRFGHQAGDDCLRRVAAAVTSSLRSSDIGARFGGDEIAVILPGTNAEGGLKVAARIRADLKTRRITPDDTSDELERVKVSVGVGTATAGQCGTRRMPEGLLIAADTALYEAKHAGRDTVATAVVTASTENAGMGSDRPAL